MSRFTKPLLRLRTLPRSHSLRHPRQPASPAAAASEPPQAIRAGAVRFIWRTDAEGRFTSVSDEFAATMGASAESFNGRTFREIAAHFGIEGQQRGRRAPRTARHVVGPHRDLADHRQRSRRACRSGGAAGL